MADSNPDLNDLLQKAEGYSAMREWPLAERTYERALELDPDSIEARYGLGAIAEIHGKLDQASDYYRSITIRNPNHAGALFQLGAIAFQRQQWKRARRYFDQAIVADPEKVPAYFNLGLVHRRLGNLEKSRDAFKKVIALDPDEPRAYYQLAVTYEKQGFLKEAEPNYAHAKRLAPDWDRATSSLYAVQDKLIEGQSVGIQEALADRSLNRSLPYADPSGAFGGGFQPTNSSVHPNQINSKGALIQVGAAMIQQWIRSKASQEEEFEDY